MLRFCGRERGAGTPVSTDSPTLKPASGDGPTYQEEVLLFYPTMLYSLRRISIHSRYKMPERPIVEGGAKRLCTVQWGRIFRILDMNFREFLFHALR